MFSIVRFYRWSFAHEPTNRRRHDRKICHPASKVPLLLEHAPLETLDSIEAVIELVD